MASTPTRDEVLAQLKRLLESKHFVRATNSTCLLTFIVEQALTGAGFSDLKEYTIGIRAFGRPDDYDPRDDSSVRTEAKHLRRRLKDYYSEEGWGDLVLIELPPGGYLPRFTKRSEFPDGPTSKKLKGPTLPAGEPKHAPSASRLTTKRRIILTSTLLISLAGCVALVHFWTVAHAVSGAAKMRILIANFSSHKRPDQYRVTRIIFEALHRALEEEPRVEVQLLDKSISWDAATGSESGHNIAVAEAQRHNALMVVWGDFDVNPVSGIFSTHIIIAPNALITFKEVAFDYVANFADVERFDAQKHLAGEVHRFVSSVFGLASLLKQDLPTCTRLLSQAISEAEAAHLPDEAAKLSYFLAQGYSLGGQTVQAIQALGVAEAYEPYRVAVRIARAGVLCQMGKFDAADTAYGALLADRLSAYGKASVYSGLADIASAQGDSFLAIKRYRNALSYQGDLLYALTALANEEIRVRHNQQAIVTLDHALSMDPGNPETLALRGQAELLHGKYEKAKIDIDHAIHITPESVLPYALRGKYFIARGKFDAGIKDLTFFLSQLPYQQAVVRISGSPSSESVALSVKNGYTSAYLQRSLAPILFT